jgi:hypothetical protein
VPLGTLYYSCRRVLERRRHSAAAAPVSSQFNDDPSVVSPSSAQAAYQHAAKDALRESAFSFIYR